MNGNQFRRGFEMLIRRLGGTVVIYRNFGAPDQTERTVRGVSNATARTSTAVVFKFLERLDIQPGDIIKQERANDLWRVDGTSDHVQGDTFVHFEVEVSRANAQGTARPKQSAGNHVHVAGSVYGGLQVGSPNSNQAIRVTVNQHFEEALAGLRDVVAKSELPELEKEEVAHTLDRVKQLADREPTPETKMKLAEKVGVIASIVGISKDLAEMAKPFIETISSHFR